MTNKLEEIFELEKEGRLDEAKAKYLALLQEEPNNVSALHQLGLLFVHLGEYAQAQSPIEKALALHPNDPTLLFHSANILKLRGLYPEAEEVYHNLIKNFPPHAAVYNNLGTVLFSQAKFKQAIEAYYQAIDLQADYVDAYYNLSLALIKNGEHSKAKHVLAMLLELSPVHPGAWFQLGTLQMLEGQHQEALKAFHNIESQHAYHFETLTNLATIYLKEGKLNEATSFYLRALEISPHDVQVLFNLGVLSMMRGKIDEALQYYFQVVQHDNQHYSAHHNLGYAFLLKNDRERALLHFRVASRLRPNNVGLLHTIDILENKKNLTSSPLEYVESLFDSYASHFDQHLQQTLQYQVPKLFIQALTKLQLLHKSLSILDLGCGTGLCGSEFKKYAKELVGVDISTQMLEIARKKNAYEQLIKADILDYLSNVSTKFDLILCADVFVYVGGLEEIFLSVKNALKPQGALIFNAEIEEEQSYRMKATGRFAHQQAYIDECLQKAGLTLLSYEIATMRTQDERPVRGHLYVVRMDHF